MKRLMVAGTVLALATGCAAGAGAAAGAVLIGVGILTYECYQYAQITVIDGATGEQTCEAEVTAIEDGDEDVLGSCYHAPLTPGRWTLRAELPGRRAAITTFDVIDREGCDHAVLSFVLTIPAPGAPAGPQPLLPATTAPAPPPPRPPAPASTPAPAPAPAPAPPPAPETAPSAPPSAAPPEAPPTQSFPDAGQ
jgi:hypothetical protein